MSDADLRALERLFVENPDDQVVLERLQDTRVRRGLGWRGETLVKNDMGALATNTESDERGVYIWRCGDLAIELVYVPAGEAPFYIGRFPVTWGEFETYCAAVEPQLGPGRRGMYHYPPRPFYATTHHPVVNVTPHGVVAAYTNKGAVPGFLDWSGLRIPTRFEWLWAALGPPDQDWHLLPRHYVSGSANPGVYLCQKCGKPCFGFETKCSVLSARTYPWGCDRPQSPKPGGSPQAFMWPNCVFDMGQPEPVLINDPGIEKKIKNLEEVKSQMVGSLYPGIAQDKIDRLKAKQRLVPARPGSRSWRNTYDMAGNVFELVQGGLALGGSFRSPTMDGWPRVTGPVREPRDDVGFRVAISAVA